MSWITLSEAGLLKREPTQSDLEDLGLSDADIMLLALWWSAPPSRNSVEVTGEDDPEKHE